MQKRVWCDQKMAALCLNSQMQTLKKVQDNSKVLRARSENIGEVAAPKLKMETCWNRKRSLTFENMH